MPNSTPGDFETASRLVLEFLRARLGFGLWMVTRVDGDDWIVLHSEDHGYGVSPGKVFRWADSFCSQMVKGNGPRIAPDSASVPAYAAAPIGRAVNIGAYVGIPLVRSDGSLFGTLCAIDPSPQPEAIRGEQALIELLASLLSTVLAQEARAIEEIRRSERLHIAANTDALTELYNRRAWDDFLASEEARCQRFGSPAAILLADLDGLKRINDTAGHAAGDALLCRAATALREAARERDIVARLGGDEFGVLALECDREGIESIARRVLGALAHNNVAASIGWSVRAPTQTLPEVQRAADEILYRRKHNR